MIRVAGLAVLIALLALEPAGGQNAPAYVEPANLNALIAAAAKEGTLNLGVGDTFGGPRGAQTIQDDLNKKYHVNLTIRYAPISAGQTFVQQLAQEVKAGQTASSDVMFTAGSKDLIPVLQQVDWRKYTPGLPSDELLYDGHAVKVLAALSGFSYNTKLIPPGQVPRSFADLLDPRWKGKIAAPPYEGTFLRYAGLPDVFGHQGLLDYLKKFAGQLGGIMVCGEIDRVVSGEFEIFGLDCGDHEVRLRERKGEPIAEFYPKEGTPLNYVAPGIPLTAAHPAAARLFITFLLTREGQDLLWNLVGEDSDLLPGSHLGQIVAQLRRQGVKIVEGGQGTGMDLQHPEIDSYVREINSIINQGR